LTKHDFDSVLQNGRLADNTPWTIPIVLDVSNDCLGNSRSGDYLGITLNSTAIARMHVEDIYNFDKADFVRLFTDRHTIRHHIRKMNKTIS